MTDGYLSPIVFGFIKLYNMLDPDAQFRGGHITFGDDNVNNDCIDFCLEQTNLTPMDRAFLLFLRSIPEEDRVPDPERRTGEPDEPTT